MVRWRLQHMSCVRSYAGAQYEFGYMHGWIGALSWANTLEPIVVGELRSELNQAYAQALRRIDAACASGHPNEDAQSRTCSR